MSQTESTAEAEAETSIHREYVLDVRIVECADGYRVDAPGNREETFADAETAELYADVYFCTNGFEEAGTGERGVPLDVLGAGRAVLAAYLLTQYGDDQWVASFFGKKPYRVREYVSWVEERAAEIRDGARERDVTPADA
ncbi:hypothetical protein [Halarchaeum nitratireducens]|uniref:Uncharacterized protein n=1 Tax=Halarchaeum nitratireducens TaxID=489913 RepID=A0A830GBN1_9EURY|nr:MULTISPECIES: hypothetical protein [Halarchaeum]MBP2250402.1 hypothetical protein [Halarchaeum solikamskense]GGN13242.1 hypothetical protein GCM10009021_11790 [Halarchaeum nitratireducens]